MTSQGPRERFFDTFGRFVETSETGPVRDRLNARYEMLIRANRHLIDGATVLDLASHDGRFSFAALQNGARHVTGIEIERHLIEKARANMAHYNVPVERFDFVEGDIFAEIPRVSRCDVVLCFGILYHINDHMLLLEEIARTDPRYVFIDSNVSQRGDAVIELRNPLLGYPPVPGDVIEGYPTRAALDVMIAALGWTADYVDWSSSVDAESSEMADYRAGRRVSIVADCHRSSLGPVERKQAVRAVLDGVVERRNRWLTILEVADRFGIRPQALNTWVSREERARWGSDVGDRP